MSKQHIPTRLRARVRATSPRHCAYCHSPEALLGIRMEIDHIISEAAGGVTVLSNLCLICSRCNRHKHARTQAPDLITGRRVRLFHPKRQRWPEHFMWGPDGTCLIGLTPCGRATVAALNMNDAFIVPLRQMWMDDGRHPMQNE